MTVRQSFYQLTTIGAIDKTEQEYKGTVCRLIKEMRLNGELPWSWLADNTRWMHKPRTYGGIDDLLEQSQWAYRRALWDPSTDREHTDASSLSSELSNSRGEERSLKNLIKCYGVQCIIKCFFLISLNGKLSLYSLSFFSSFLIVRRVLLGND